MTFVPRSSAPSTLPTTTTRGRKFWLGLAALCLSAAAAWAQNVNVNPGGGSYPTLKAAFDAINAGTHTGALTIDIVGNVTEASGTTASLKASGSGAASYTSVLIRPSGGASRTISGVAPGLPLVELNGADHVTIDGLNTGGNSLTIRHASNGAACAIRFINDATNNTVTRCSVLGDSSAEGVIVFSTGLTTGNDNNTISNCNIGPASAELPVCGILSEGTSAAIDNSGIVISGNNIFDFFSNFPSSGINPGIGSSGWTITGNSFYQTGTRSYDSSNTHAAIAVSAGGGYTISGNFIGGSAPNAVGLCNLTGTVASTARFVGISLTSGSTTPHLVQNNTIANVTLRTTSGSNLGNGALCGIQVTAGDANVIGNTIGSTTGVDSLQLIPATSGAMVVGIHSGTTGTISIQNNTIGALSSSGSIAVLSGSACGINVSGAATSLTIANNTIGNATPGNLRGGTVGLTTSSAEVTGISLSVVPAAGSTINLSGNTIRNLLTASSHASAYVRGIQLMQASATTAVVNVTGNTISNLSSNNANTNLGGGLTSVTGIAYGGGSADSSISDNTISGLANTNAAAVSTWVVGIGHGNSHQTVMARNRIFGLANAGTATTLSAPSGIAGILIYSGNNEITLQNNMVALGAGQTTNTAILGLFLHHGNAGPFPRDNIYFNSVHLEGVVASGALPSVGLLRGDLSTVARTTTVNLRNNVLSNSRTGGTGKHYAIANNLGATATALGWTASASNYNVLNSANPATIGYWTSDQSLAGWQAVSGGDGFSFTAPSLPFVNAAAGDLHVNFGTTPTPLESGGTPVASLTTDFDNQARPGPAGSLNGGAFAPDIGADEFDGVALDIFPPVIAYTPLPFTSTLGNRTLVATITDSRGVPTAPGSPGLPVLYWRINAGPYTAATGTSLGSNQFQFTFGAGVVPGDTVSYYVVAQDTAPLANLSAFPAGASGLTANPPAAATPPPTPSSYPVTVPLAPGTYTVGSGGDFANLTTALANFSTRGLSGPVVFTLIDPTYTEAGAMTIGRNPDSSPTNTLTIRPAPGVTATVSATVANGAVLKILSNYVTVDGSNNGTHSRDLTLTNLSATVPVVAHIGSTGTTPIAQVALRNCVIINGATTSTAVVVGDGATTGTGYFNNITLQNNDVQRAFIGILGNAVVAPGNGSGLVIADNLMNTSGANAIRRMGCSIQGFDGATVSGNTIGNFNTTNAEIDYGIWLGPGTVNTTVSGNAISGLGCTVSNFAPSGIWVNANNANANLVVTGNTISNLSSISGAANTSTNGILVDSAVGGVTISRNRISNLKTSSAWGANGLLLRSSLAAANVNVSNNFVWDVAAAGVDRHSADDNGQGIAVVSGGGYAIHDNSILLATNQTSAAGHSSALLVATTAVGAIDLRGNILAVTTTVGSASPVYVVSAQGATVFADINYNDYFSSGSVGFLGTARASLADWRTATGRDANSIAADPLFVSTTDLHLQAASPAGNAGTPLAGVALDLDGQPRSAARPEIGADELPSVAALTNLTLSAGVLDPTFATGTLTYAASVGSGTASLTATPATADVNSIIQARVNGGSFATVASGSPSGPLALNLGANTVDVRVSPEFGSPLTYTVSVTRGAAPPVPAPVAIATTRGQAISFSASAIVAWATDPGGNTPIVLLGVGQPIGGAATGTVSNGGGNITFTPQAAFLGTDTFSYTIQNSAGAQAVGVITVTVTEYPARAVATSRTTGGVFSTTYAGVPNVRYRIEFTDVLTVGFQPLLDGLGQPVAIVADGTGSFSFSQSGTPTQRFFRARALP